MASPAQISSSTDPIRSRARSSPALLQWISETMPIFTRTSVRGEQRSSLEDRRDYFLDAALYLGIVGECPDDTNLAGTTRRDPLGDELAGVDEEAGAYPLGEAVLAQVAHLLAQLRQLGRRGGVDAG